MLSVELYGSASTFKFEFFSIFGQFLAFFAGSKILKLAKDSRSEKFAFAEHNFSIPPSRRCLKAGRAAGRKPGGM